MLNPVSSLNSRLFLLLSIAVPAAVAVMGVSTAAHAAPTKPTLQDRPVLNGPQLQPKQIDPSLLGRYSCPACRSGRDPRFDGAINPNPVEKIKPAIAEGRALGR